MRKRWMTWQRLKQERAILAFLGLIPEKYKKIDWAQPPPKDFKVT